MNKVIAPLIFGENSPAVSDLQASLSKLGFGEINADELNRVFFGENTCKALSTFKDKFRIKIFPCLVESQTADKINQRLEQVADGQPHKVRSPLVFGMKSEGVRDLQTALRMIGFGAGIEPAENNTFGKTTCEAVVGFQREMGIQVVPCYVENETAEKINSLIGESPNGEPIENKELYYPNKTYYPFPPTGASLA